MSDKSPLSIDDFLSELKASLSQADGDAALRRINAERLLRLVADEFIDAFPADRIRVLPDSRLVGESGADLLLQIDDYDIRLELLDAAEGKPNLASDRLPVLLQLLENNPSTVTLILVWTTDDLLSVEMNVAQIRSLIDSPEHLTSVLESAKPLGQVLRNVVALQVKVWDAEWDVSARGASQPLDLRQLFEQAFDDAVRAECGRPYKSPTRKAAAEHFAVDREKRVIMSALNDALSGEPSDTLKQQLAGLPQRGAQ